MMMSAALIIDGVIKALETHDVRISALKFGYEAATMRLLSIFQCRDGPLMVVRS
jgi:hypothetical protein